MITIKKADGAFANPPYTKLLPSLQYPSRADGAPHATSAILLSPHEYKFASSINHYGLITIVRYEGPRHD